MPPRVNLEMTTTQKEVYDFYSAYAAEHGTPPTVMQMTEALKIQRSTIYQAIDSLTRKGFLKERPITIKRLMPVKRRPA